MSRSGNMPSNNFLPNPLEVPPEIVQMCGQLISREDQAKCMRVSKTWHNSMAPILWKTLEIDIEYRALRTEDLVDLPWDGLRTYGCYVRHVKVNHWKQFLHNGKQIESSCRGDWESWETIFNLPGVLSLHLCDLSLEKRVFSIFDNICTRIRSLETRNCTIPVLEVKKTNTPWTIQKLSISRSCEIDVVALADRCPNLQVLSVGRAGKSPGRKKELKRFQGLANHLDSGALSHLKHLDVGLARSGDQEVASFIQSMRCLRSIQSLVELGSLSLSGLRSHFHTIREIEVQKSHLIPRFWREVMSSCPVLTSATEVFFSLDDILCGAPWVCKHLVVLCLTFGDIDIPKANRKEYSLSEIQTLEHALLRRISGLGKLGQLYIDERLCFKYDSAEVNCVSSILNSGQYPVNMEELVSRSFKNPKRLDVESLGLLSTLTQLRILSVGSGFCEVLDKTTAEWVASLKVLEQFNGYWPLGCKETAESVKMLRQRGVKAEWYNNY